jgi:hypothetical protein
MKVVDKAIIEQPVELVAIVDFARERNAKLGGDGGGTAAPDFHAVAPGVEQPGPEPAACNRNRLGTELDLAKGGRARAERRPKRHEGGSSGEPRASADVRHQWECLPC